MALSLLLSVLLALYFAKRVWVVVQANKVCYLGARITATKTLSLQHDKRFRRLYTTIMPLSILGSLLPTTWWNLGLKFIWRDRHGRK